MKLEKIGYSLKDITIVQSCLSEQNHRSDVNPFITVCDRKVLPIFVAPMASVTDENNYKTWINNKVTPVVPRSVQNRMSLTDRIILAKETFVSFSLNEAKELLQVLKYVDDIFPVYVCIDIAHGTLSELFSVCKNLKEQYGDKIVIMTGNIANPKAYASYCKCGIDYVRVGIGGGSRCTSSANVGVHYPMATLLADIYNERSLLNTYNNMCEKNGGMPIKITKVIADGGINWYDDINKSLALGADAVMIGKLFAECEEACGEKLWAYSKEAYMAGRYLTSKERQYWVDNEENYGDLYLSNAYESPQTLKPFREYYGMSTREAQKITGGDGNKTSEGISRPVEIKHSVVKWLNNVEAYLRSAMTYTNSKTIQDFNNAECIILGGMTYQTYSK